MGERSPELFRSVEKSAGLGVFAGFVSAAAGLPGAEIGAAVAGLQFIKEQLKDRQAS